MAFISSQTLLAPFKNPVHLTSIFMVAVLFAVFRLNGGGLSVEESRRVRTQQPAQRTAAPVSSRDLSKYRRAEPTRAVTPSAAERAPVKKKKKVIKRKPVVDNSMADIERSIGLR